MEDLTWIEIWQYPITNVEFMFTTMLINLMLYVRLFGDKIVLKKPQDLSTILKNKVNLIHY